MNERQMELAREKAKRLRYKKPAARGMTLDEIRTRLSDIREEIGELDGLLWDEEMLEELLGSEEDAFEFKVAFSDLESDCERMQEALEEMGNLLFMADEDAEEVFDRFFPAARYSGDFYGFDEYQGDYYALEYYETDAAEKAARDRIKRLTKDQLLDAAGACCRIMRQYLALDYRHDCLSAALEVLHGRQEELIRITKVIDELYEKAEQKTHGFQFNIYKEVFDLDRALDQLPVRFWVE